MSGIELFVWMLLGLGWVIFEIVRRVLRTPKPLGTIAEEEPPIAQAPERQPVPRRPSPPPPQLPPDFGRGRPAPEALDTAWGRSTPPVVASLPAATGEPFSWAADAAQHELALAREMARRQQRARSQLPPAAARRHPYRPQLRTAEDVRRAVVLATVIGPCRAIEPYRPPDAP